MEPVDDTKWKANFLASAFQNGGTKDLNLAMQITDTQPCHTCLCVHYHCKCPPNPTQK